jgi:hypothetical protein
MGHILRDNSTVPKRETVRLADSQRRAEDFKVHFLYTKSRPRFDETGSEVVWDCVGPGGPGGLNVELL